MQEQQTSAPDACVTDEATVLAVDLGDVAELTLGSGSSTQESKRQVYN